MRFSDNFARLSIPVGLLVAACGAEDAAGPTDLGAAGASAVAGGGGEAASSGAGQVGVAGTAAVDNTSGAAGAAGTSDTGSAGAAPGQSGGAGAPPAGGAAGMAGGAGAPVDMPAGAGGVGSGDATAGTDSGGTAGMAAGAGGTEAGAGGAAGAGAGTGGSSEPCGAEGLTFCSDFEAGIPAEATYYPEYQQANMGDFLSTDGEAHSGSQALKFVGSDFSQMLGVPTGAATFWGRIYLRSDSDIQSGHNTYVAATDGTGDPNDGEQIRIGEHQCQLELNRKTDDAEKLSNGGTYECAGGFEMTAGTWYCLEFHYDGPGSEVQVFVDSTEIEALHVTDWGPYDYKLFKFGFEKYHGDAKNLWYDDLALGSQRIGCME